MGIRLKRSCEASVDIDADVETVWELVSDPTRTGEWSVECRGAEMAQRHNGGDSRREVQRQEPTQRHTMV